MKEFNDQNLWPESMARKRSTFSFSRTVKLRSCKACAVRWYWNHLSTSEGVVMAPCGAWNLVWGKLQSSTPVDWLSRLYFYLSVKQTGKLTKYNQARRCQFWCQSIIFLRDGERLGHYVTTFNLNFLSQFLVVSVVINVMNLKWAAQNIDNS